MLIMLMSENLYNQDNYEYIEGESQDIRANATRELATYLWENYIEYAHLAFQVKRVNRSLGLVMQLICFFWALATHMLGLSIFLAAMVWFSYNTRNNPIDAVTDFYWTESCVDRVTFIVSFVAENSLQSVRRPADDYISQWYYEVSFFPHIYIALSISVVVRLC